MPTLNRFSAFPFGARKSMVQMVTCGIYTYEMNATLKSM